LPPPPPDDEKLSALEADPLPTVSANCFTGRLLEIEPVRVVVTVVSTGLGDGDGDGETVPPLVPPVALLVRNTLFATFQWVSR
jgi:hypothetical protein